MSFTGSEFTFLIGACCFLFGLIVGVIVTHYSNYTEIKEEM